MSRWFTLGACAALIGALALASPAVAAPHQGHPGSGGGAGQPHSMPPQGFRGAPPNFHGSYPYSHPGAPHGGFGPGGHYSGRYHGHDFGHFTPGERHAWEHGEWRHSWHNGHLGWWWFAGGSWFFYPQPIYPYPAYVGPDYYYNYDDEYGAPPYYWYYCEDPQGYYPYVKACNGPWQPVPPTPQDQ